MSIVGISMREYGDYLSFLCAIASAKMQKPNTIAEAIIYAIYAGAESPAPLHARQIIEKVAPTMAIHIATGIIVSTVFIPMSPYSP